MDEKFWITNPLVPSVRNSIKSLVLDRVPFRRLTQPLVFNSVNLLLDNYNERLFLKSTPRVVIDGRRVKLLDAITGLAGRFGLLSLVPPGPPGNVFGLAAVQNVTTDKMEVWTGVDDKSEKFGDVYKWNGMKTLNKWKGNCNIITGTNGELFKPFVQKDKSLRVFIASICRSIDLTPLGEVVLSNGMKTLEYQFSPQLFMGASKNPANLCL